MPEVKRLQNHSCGQCRRSKKACDGFLINSGKDSPKLGTLPCSYCVKTKKQCSLNTHWARPRVQSSQTPSGSSPGERVLHAKRQRTEDGSEAAQGPLVQGDIDPGLDGQHHLDWNTPFLGLNAPTTSSASNPLDFLYEDGNTILEESPLSRHQDFPLNTSSASADQVHHAETGAFANPAVDCLSQPSSLSMTTWDLSQPYPAPRASISSTHSPYRRQSTTSRYRSHGDPEDWHEGSSTSLSPYGTDHVIMASSNSNLITESLLRIYHDVLENNLACWITEDTCPYRMKQRQHGQLSTRGQSVLPEWGAVWSNRIYRRVKQLDRVAQATKMVRLTRSENRAASRALDLAIMAFATQWAQGNRRREKFPDTSTYGLDPSLSDDDEDFGDDFEQTLQQSMWEQARKALQDVADLESYRVVYAELIFGLIQKPWGDSDYSEHSSVGSDSGNQANGFQASVLSQVMDIISQDGPPIYLERATRKVHALKFQFEANETSQQSHIQYDEEYVQSLSVEQRGTIGLLYWMAVMFDTVSSSMNERPVAVADEDCQHDAAHATAAENSAASGPSASQRWALDLYAQDNPERPWPLHWPCPYDIATKAVARSAAVKVLLFRYVSYLQNAIRKQERGQPIEDIIASTTSVYRYWNMTHGAFFRDLTKNYNSVPTRIKSWFPCIGIPWHLAALMLADLIDLVDDQGLGMEAASAARRDANMAARIRRASSIELSDLARVATPQEFGDMPVEQLPDFHFAVSEGTLLTEPWTVLLVRAFTKAAVYHLGVADDLRKHDWTILGHASEEFQASLIRGDSCIKALWFLGRKSEMARSLAKVLAKALYTYQAGQIV